MKPRKLRHSTRYMIIICIFLLAMNFILGFILIQQAKKSMITLINNHMLDVSNTAAASLNGDLLGTITTDVTDSEAYNEIVTSLRLFQQNIDLAYIYTVREMGDKYYGFIVDPDPIDPGAYGEPVQYTEALEKAGHGTAAVDKEAFHDRWGTFYSAYSPVFDSNGNVVGIVGVDFNAGWYEKQIHTYTASIIITSILSLLIGAVIVVLITTQIRKRLNSVYDELSALATDVESLNKEMTSNTGYNQTTDSLKKEDADTLISDPDSRKSLYLSNDAIDSLGSKIKHMHKEMTNYISYVHKQAFTDPMTGVGNKTAYLDLVKNLNRKIEKGTAAFTVIVFDVNGLKTVNDNCGHEYGDMIISDTALVIKRIYTAECVFRIGGDEFIAVLDKEYTDDYIAETFVTLDKELEAFNKNEKQYEMNLSFSKGAAIFRKETDTDYKTVFKRADEAMYANKGMYYRTFGDRRKRKD
ncbi:MAG: diguanylate cyclase [Lachnospiraceae bacterium]|nr:diguanylate cyclase [Lachnospiraceae bacterium]